MTRGASEASLARIRLLVCDVDGTLTDGAMWYGPEGEIAKRFHTRDGHGIGLLRASGVEVALITAENSPIVTARAAKLGITHVVLGCSDKAAAVRLLATQLGVAREEIATIGDDLGDLPAFDESGISVAVADAMPTVRGVADIVCATRGGEGAVRELADLILTARQRVAQES